MKRCLVTGGAGFIGSALVRHLLLGKENASCVGRVVVLDKLTYAGRRENLAECGNAAKKKPSISIDNRDILVGGVEAACGCECLPLPSYRFLSRGAPLPGLSPSGK